MNENFFLKIIDKYLTGDISREEERLLNEYYKRLNEKERISLSDERQEVLRKLMLTNILTAINPPQKRVKSFFLRVAVRLSVAASLLVILAFGFYFYTTVKIREPKIVLLAKFVKGAGEKTRAMLTLSNGFKIELGGIKAGAVANDNGVLISKVREGKLDYHAVSGKGTEPTPQLLSQTLEVSTGSSYEIGLSDGSKIWLNAASTFSFPAKFGENTRKVSLSGEGYFEVAKNKLTPFLVTSGRQLVEVLGTRFNINSYPDEEIIKTTLTEGSVKISVSGTTYSGVLKPGQQALVDKLSLRIKNTVNPDEAISWQKGFFTFKNENIQTVMREISRWYNVEVSYQGIPAQANFGGSISKSKSLKEVLRSLELTKAVHFKVEGRRVTVMK